ncbi:MAG: hypothetical protein AAGA77_13635 [Bacteroidota bacterium]
MNKSWTFIFSVFFLFSCADDSHLNTVTNTGTNGSYTRMVIANNYMYKVSDEELTTYEITNPEEIVEINRQNVGFLIESFFHLEGILFIGSGEALHIFEIDASGIPERRSRTDYTDFADDLTPCDPVVSDGTYAYVTLSSVVDNSDPCGRQIVLNELRIYDVTDLTNPIQVNAVNMINPKGLAYDQDLLFVCENDGGLKVFDKSDVTDLHLIHHFEDINTFDVIAKNGLLIVIGQGAIYQFNYTSISDMSLISKLDL